MDEMGREQLKSSICRKAVSYSATIAQLSLSRCKVSLMLIQFLDRKYIVYKKNAFLVIISMTVKQAYLETKYNCQLVWLAIRLQC